MKNNPEAIRADNPELSDELQRFAADLSRLYPRDDRLDRQRLAFLAGQASIVPSQSKAASRAWPAAFAAMSAVAATLLCMLLTRPEKPGAPSIAADARVHNGPQSAIEDVTGHAVLTTRDARLTDIESRLTELDADRTGADTTPLPVDDLIRPVFTPSAWQQVINETEPVEPSHHKSSSLSPTRGVDT